MRRSSSSPRGPAPARVAPKVAAPALVWDDLRYVLALVEAGSLARTAKALGVDHTTVGRRVEAAEQALGTRLFARTSTGYVPTAEAEALFARMRSVEDAVHALERGAQSRHERIEGVVRVTSPETFGCLYLAPCLAGLRREHPGLSIELRSTGAILDLARREADLAVRMFRSPHESLVVRRIGALRHGLYASRAYLARRPIRRLAELADHPLLTGEPSPGAVDAKWLARLVPGVRPALVCDLSVALLSACRAGAGVAVLPSYLGGADPSLEEIPAPDPPSEAIWMTVHRDLREAPRVRAVMDHLVACIARDKRLLEGR
jgi:DNA-binding transcriptional LysR family regulator